MADSIPRKIESLQEFCERMDREKTAQFHLNSAGTDMLRALKQALIKLRVFRSNTNGEYQGGMEYSSLVKMIEEAIAKAEGK